MSETNNNNTHEPETDESTAETTPSETPEPDFDDVDISNRFRDRSEYSDADVDDQVDDADSDDQVDDADDADADVAADDDDDDESEVKNQHIRSLSKGPAVDESGLNSGDDDDDRSVIEDPEPIEVDLKDTNKNSTKKYTTKVSHNINDDFDSWDSPNVETNKSRLLDPRKTKDGDISLILSDESLTVEFIIPSQLIDNVDCLSDLRPGDLIKIKSPGDQYGYASYSVGSDIEIERHTEKPLSDVIIKKSQLEMEAQKYMDAGVSEEIVDEKLAQTMRNNMGILSVKKENDDLEYWSLTDEKTWASMGKIDIKTRLNDILPPVVNENSRREEIAKRVLHHPDTTTKEDHFRLGPPDGELKWMVPAQNGMVDLREPPTESSIRPHREDDYTHDAELLDVDFDPSAECPNIEEALMKVAGGDETKLKTYYEVLAIMLMRNNDYQRFIIKVGDTDTGKSNLDKLIKALCSEDSAENVKIHDLANGDFEMAAVERSYAVIDDDVSSNKLSTAQSAVVKRLVGDGGVRSASKFQDQVSHDPYATLTCNANNPFLFTEFGNSIKNRILPLFFDQQFVRSPSAENEHKKIPSSELEDKITTDDELSGLLNKIIKASVRLRKQQGHTSIELREGKDTLIEKYTNYADNTERFLKTCTRQTNGFHKVTKNDWMEIYTRWCDSEDIEPQKRQKFFRQMRESTERYVEFGRSNNERYTKTIIPTPDCLSQYAPPQIKEKYKSWSDKPGQNNIDSIQPVESISPGFATIQGEISTKTHIKGRESIILHCDTGRMVVSSETPEIETIIDSTETGDVLRVKSGYIDKKDMSVMLVVPGETEWKIVNRNDEARQAQTGVNSHKSNESESENDDSNESESIESKIKSQLEQSNEPHTLTELSIDIGEDRDEVENTISEMINQGDVMKPAPDYYQLKS